MMMMISINVCWSSYKEHVLLSDLNEICIFATDFLKTLENHIS